MFIYVCGYGHEEIEIEIEIEIYEVVTKDSIENLQDAQPT